MSGMICETCGAPVTQNEHGEVWHVSSADPRALVAAALERAASEADAESKEQRSVSIEQFSRGIDHSATEWAARKIALLAKEIRALIDTDHAAALEAVRAEARAEGRKACERAVCKVLNIVNLPATTPAEAARVLLDGIPNPIFDALKPVLIGEHHVSLPALDDDGREHVRKVNVPWVVQKQIIAAALRAIADGGDDE